MPPLHVRRHPRAMSSSSNAVGEGGGKGARGIREWRRGRERDAEGKRSELCFSPDRALQAISAQALSPSHLSPSRLSPSPQPLQALSPSHLSPSPLSPSRLSPSRLSPSPLSPSRLSPSPRPGLRGTLRPRSRGTNPSCQCRAPCHPCTPRGSSRGCHAQRGSRPACRSVYPIRSS